MPPQQTQPKNRDILQSLNELRSEGFPTQVSSAFQEAADELNCVIWSRVPGAATTTLINEGYDLKPFNIKGKSCNWGPMAGFVCQLPAFNKAGRGKMQGNLKAHLKSLEALEQKQQAEIAIFDQKNPSKQGLELTRKYAEIGISSSLFVPLVVSDLRKAELLKDFLSQPGNSAHEIDRDHIVGIAQDIGQTVAIEYLMKRQAPGNLWHLYHRNIVVKKDDDTYVSYLAPKDEGFELQNPLGDDVTQLRKYNAAIATSPGTREASTAAINSKLSELSRGLDFERALNAATLTHFHPIRGLQSTFVVYNDDANRYKNAVSGDYDLFAVWPLVPASSFELTARISELKAQRSPDLKSQNLFIPIETKKSALEITKARNVFIEFIGTFAELDGVEDPEVGNISELVAATAQTINSLVTAINQGETGPFPNRAFHSDEGGRPQVDEIEYPIAFFMPTTQWTAIRPIRHRGESKADFERRQADFDANIPILKNTAGLVQSHIEFVSLVLALKKRFHIFLHDGWMTHLMCLATGKNALSLIVRTSQPPVVSDKGKRYFKSRIQEIEALGSTAMSKLILLLKELLTPLPPDKQTDQRTITAHNAAFDLVSASFVEIASEKDLPLAPARINKILENKIELPD